MNGLPIAATERETRVSKELLRMWERRYGFPSPQRDEHGDRVYSADEIEKLKLVRVLIDRGFRPGRLVGMDIQALRQLQGGLGKQPGQTAEDPGHELLQLLQQGDVKRIHSWFARELSNHGLKHFITVSMPEANRCVGEAWRRGTLAIHEEHLYTEQVQQLLRLAMQPFYLGGNPPKILLTTLPEEQHGLGLLMVEVMLRMNQCEVLSFGPGMPLADTLEAATVHGVDIVGLSISAAYGEAQAQQGVSALLAALPKGTQLWVGGQGSANLRLRDPQLLMIRELGELAEAVTRWRAQRVASAH
ncbi:MerR family transcriptional regulator [Chitinimonas sp. BJYL2]|uniref:MerR family transcriptional regulator n=1 Tax=Chitinimonas sp. BJYL2 TaxID=2976696 RepID=UPI0022B5896B|nr:MerR family transcriptional regulator [Chitinimonas sp. BJYL2]